MMGEYKKSFLPTNKNKLKKKKSFLCHVSKSRKGRLTIYSGIIVQSLSCVRLFVIPWTAALQDSLSFTISQSLLKFMSIESVISSNHLILCLPLFLLPSVFPSIKVFSNESGLCIRWPKFWSFSFSIDPSNEYFRVDFL